jgi:hypothetical protein
MPSPFRSDLHMGDAVVKIEIGLDGERCSEKISRLLTLADANFSRQRLDRLVKFDDIWWRGSSIGNRDWLYLLLVDDRARRVVLFGQSIRTVRDDVLDGVDDVVCEASNLLDTGHFAVMDRGEGILLVVDPLRIPTSSEEIVRVFTETEEALVSATRILVAVFGPRYSFDPTAQTFPVGRHGPSYDQYLNA